MKCGLNKYLHTGINRKLVLQMMIWMLFPHGLFVYRVTESRELQYGPNGNSFFFQIMQAQLLTAG